MHAIQDRQAIRARTQQTKLQRGLQRRAIAGVTRMQICANGVCLKDAWA
jgi:hypothetical protein